MILLTMFEEHGAWRNGKVDYYARLRRRMPKPLSARASKELDEVTRGER